MIDTPPAPSLSVFEAAFAHLPDAERPYLGLARDDGEGLRLVDVCARMGELNGYTREECLGARPSRLGFAPETDQTLIARAANDLRRSGVAQFENAFRTRDGEPYRAHFTMIGGITPAGAIAWALYILRRTGEGASRDANAPSIAPHALLEHAEAAGGMCCFRWDPVTRRWLWSRHAVDVLGVPEHADPKDWPLARALGASAADAVMRAMSGAGGASVSVCTKAVLPDGCARWVQVSAEPQRDVTGAQVGYVGVLIDIEERTAAVSAAREAEGRYRTAARHAGVGVIELDPGAGVLHLSHEARCLLGDPSGAASVTLREWGEHVHPEDADGCVAKLSHMDGCGPEAHCEARVRTSAGGYRWMAARLARTPSCQSGRLTGALVDVDARRRHEIALRATERRHALAVDVSGVALWEWNQADARMSWSPEFQTMVGAKTDHASLDDFLALLPPEQSDDVASAIARAMAADADDAFAIDHQLRMADGAYRWVQTKGRVDRPLDGAPTLVAAVIDADDARREIEELALARARVSDVVNLTGEAVFELDAHGRVAFVSDRAQSVWGLTPASLEGAPATHILAALDPECRTAVMKAARTGRITDLDVRATRPDGQAVWLRLNAQRRTDLEGRHAGWRGAVLDITARKGEQLELEAAKKAADAAANAKATFLATMSHEIRAPLNAIMGMTDVLAQADLQDAHAELVVAAQSAAGHVLRLINDVLDVSKIEASGVALSQTTFSPSEVIDDVVVMLSGRAHDKGLSLIVAERPSPQAQIVGDPDRLRQVLVNLIDNAVKFTEAGGVEISARLEDAERVPRLNVSIADTGVGVPADALATLFDDFTQADANGVRDQSGTGLGLAICRRLVEAMDGEITCRPRPEGGTMFDFHIAAPTPPATATEPVAPPPTTEPKAPATRPTAPKPEALRVLVCEDNDANRMFMRLLLERLGHDAVLVQDGVAGVEAAEAQVFDAILMDLRMPGMDGVAAASAIRAGQGPNRATSIIALTAEPQPEQGFDPVESVFDAWLTKPFKVEELHNALNAPSAHTDENDLIVADVSDALALDLDFVDVGDFDDIVEVSDQSTPQATQDLTRDEPLLDESVLTPFLSVAGPEAFAPVLDAFASSMEELLDTLDAAIADHDDDALARTVHAMFGAASSIGAARLAALAKGLDAASGTDLRAYADAARATLAESQAAIAHIMTKSRGSTAA